MLKKKELTITLSEPSEENKTNCDDVKTGIDSARGLIIHSLGSTKQRHTQNSEVTFDLEPTETNFEKETPGSNKNIPFVKLALNLNSIPSMSSISFKSDSKPQSPMSRRMAQSVSWQGNSSEESLTLNDIHNLKIIFPLFIINPFGYFRKLWTFFIVALLLYTALFFPFKICFIEDNHDWWVSDLFIDVSFMLDIFVNFMSAYETDTGIIIYKPREIMWNYLKGWFVVDLCSSFPLYLVLENISGNYNNLMRISKIPRLYKLARIFRIIKLLKILRLSKFFDKLLFQLKFKTHMSLMIRLIFIVLFLIHITGCLWYFLSTLEDEEIDSWIFRNKFTDTEILDRYVASIYYVLTVLLTIGYANIVAESTNERIFIIFYMFLGIWIYGYVMGSLTNAFSKLNEQTTLIKEREFFYKEFANLFKIPGELLETILITTNNFFKSSQSNLLQVYSKEKLMQELPPLLYAEVCSHVFQEIVDKFDLFQDKPFLFIIKILPKLTPLVLNYGDEVYKEGEPALSVYFNLRGRIISMCLDEKGIERTQVFVSGSYFGEVDIILKRARSETAYSETSSEVWKIDKLEFLSLLDEFEDIKKEIISQANKREEERKSTRKFETFFQFTIEELQKKFMTSLTLDKNIQKATTIKSRSSSLSPAKSGPTQRRSILGEIAANDPANQKKRRSKSENKKKAENTKTYSTSDITKRANEKITQFFTEQGFEINELGLLNEEFFASFKKKIIAMEQEEEEDAKLDDQIEEDLLKSMRINFLLKEFSSQIESLHENL